MPVEEDPEAVHNLRNVVKIWKRNWGTDMEDPQRGLKVLPSKVKAQGQTAHAPFTWPTVSHPSKVISKVMYSRVPSLPPLSGLSQGPLFGTAMVPGLGSTITLLMLCC